MNIVSNHNRLLRGAAIPTAGGDVYNSGWEYTPEGEISGYSGSAIYTGEGCQCDSAAIVDSAFNQSTAWVDEQNYLTAHQDVTNLPYVQNSALEFSPQGLISGISGSGLYATSAENAFTAETANFAYNAEHAESAESAENTYSAQFANSASSALNAEVANVAYTALTAQFLDGGWEHDVDGFITAYNNSAFAGAGGGGRYEGIEPIVVNNEEMRISAKSAVLGVQEPLYFVEDSETATVIGIQESAISGKGIEYSGIAPIVVDNENHLISAQSAKLGVQGPLYFVEDTPTSTVIGIDNSAFPTFEGTPEGKISAINGSALNADPVIDYSAGNNIDITDHVISVTGSVPSADRASYAVSATSSHYSHSAIEAASAGSATYDNLGREITATYLTAVTGDNTPYSAGANIDITDHVVSGKDWSSEISDASANAVTEATNTITAVEFANSASALTTSAGWDVTEYTAGANIDITNHVVSGKDWSDNITAASSYAYNQATAQIPNTANLPYVQNTALNIANGSITSISSYNVGHPQVPVSGESGIYLTKKNGTVYIGYSGEGGGGGATYEGVAPIVVNNVEHKISAQSAVLGVQEPLYFVEDSETATVIGISGLPEVEGVMYESALGKSNNKITAYNGTAFAAGNTYDVKAGSNISVSTAGTTFTVSGKDWTNTITGASSYAYNQATANATGKYIPYTNITTGISGTQAYNVNKGIRVTSTSGWVEIYNQNKENENEAHLQVGQNYADGKSFWSELDGAGGGFLQLNWNSGTIGPNAHTSYSDETTAAIYLGNGALVYRSATHNITATGEGEGGDNENKVWQLGSERVRFWNQWGTASFGPRGMDVYDSIGNNHWYTTAADSATRFRIIGSAGDGTIGAVDITPGYINFYNDDWSLNQTWNTTNIADTKALYNHVQSASAEWGKTYSGISPIIVDNTARTIDISGYGLSGINVNIWKDDVHHVIVISAAPGGASIDYTTGSI